MNKKEFYKINKEKNTNLTKNDLEYLWFCYLEKKYCWI